MTQTEIVTALREALKREREETGDYSGVAEIMGKYREANDNATKSAEDAWQFQRSVKILKALLWIAVTIGGAAAAALGWYSTRIEDRTRAVIEKETETKAAAIRVEFVDSEIGRLDGAVQGVSTSLDEHVDEQRTENQASRDRTVRTEVMVESLLRSRGRKPPKKSNLYKARQRAAGVDPDDPLNGLKPL
jgi:hypothetical protein